MFAKLDPGLSLVGLVMTSLSDMNAPTEDRQRVDQRAPGGRIVDQAPGLPHATT
jgi:hypothetical protein